MEKLEKGKKNLFYNSFEEDNKELMVNSFKFLYMENETVFFTLEASEEEIAIIRKKWGKIKPLILEIFEAKDISYINKINLDEVFISKLIEICKAKKIELVGASKKAS